MSQLFVEHDWCVCSHVLCLLPTVLSANPLPYPCDMLLLLQVCLKVRHHWSRPERGPLQSWAAISVLRPKNSPPQTSFLCMWWNGCASVTTFPSSSNLEYTLLEFIQTTRVRDIQMCSIIHSFHKVFKTCVTGNPIPLLNFSYCFSDLTALRPYCGSLNTFFWRQQRADSG